MPPSCGEGKWTPGKSILFSSVQACWADGQRASSTGILYGTRGNRSAAASLLERSRTSLSDPGLLASYSMCSLRASEA